MNDTERISRLVGAAISECSSSRLEEVKGVLKRAMLMLGDVRENNARHAAKEAGRSFIGMTRQQRDAAVRVIDDMIEGEQSKVDGGGERVDLFG